MPKKTKKAVFKVLEKKELEKLEPEEQSSYIVKLITDCASEIDKDPSEVIWLDFRDHIKMAWGQNQAGITPRLITRLGGFNRIRDAHFPPKVTSTHLEKISLMEATKVNRKFANMEMYDEYFVSKLKEIMEETASSIKIHTLKKQNKKQKTTRTLNLILSDLHYQSQLKKEETGHAYGSIEEARRTSHIFDVVANYKLDHRKETELAIYLIGDVIQNQLHDSRDGAPIAEQMAASLKYLIEGIAYVASAFNKVTVLCSTGNHGRNTARHKNRAVHQKWDSLETSIYHALASVFKMNTDRVKFVIPKTPWVEWETQGHLFYATHGDTAFNPGNPGKAINTKNLQEQVNNINAARRKEGLESYKVFFAGHIHRAMATFLDNGVVVFTNAPLCPPDGFANSIGVYSVQCGQWLVETTKNHFVGDFRLIKVGEEQDSDKNLDKIVKPYEGGFGENSFPNTQKFNKK